MLGIAGERKFEKEEKDRNYQRVERSYGRCGHSFALPDGVDDTKLAAEYKDGVLRVRLPKCERTKPKSIDVAVG